MKLIVGLGNPGKKYQNTRHNIGFTIIDFYIEKNNIILNNDKFDGKFGTFFHNGEKIIIAKPLTFMNNSGNFVASVVAYYGIELKDILIIVDDKDQETGSFKLKVNSSSGGQKGIKSIIELLGTKDFLRLKVGIGKPHQNQDTASFVIANFTKVQINDVKNNFETFNKIIGDFIIGKDTKELLNTYNGK